MLKYLMRIEKMLDMDYSTLRSDPLSKNTQKALHPKSYPGKKIRIKFLFCCRKAPDLFLHIILCDYHQIVTYRSF